MPYLEASIESIIKWPVEEVEILVQDGGSTDGTQAFLRRFEDRISLESAPDHGQADALNKGIIRSNGRYVGWLNADDLYSRDAWQTLRPVLRDDAGPEAVYGDFGLIFEDGSTMREIKLREVDWSHFCTRGRSVLPWSGATFWRRDVFERFGLFDTSLHYCMDMEYYLRVARHITTQYIPSNLGQFRVRDTSKSGSQTWKFFGESHRVRIRHTDPTALEVIHAYKHTAKSFVYYATKRARESRAYSRLRPVHRH